jgi:hypothetical protein
LIPGVALPTPTEEEHMRRTVFTVLSLAVCLTVLAVPPLAAQSDSGHVYVLTYWKTLPGQGGAYATYMREVSYPYYDEVVRRGGMLSYRFVAQGAGTGDYTHLFIAEYENWDAVDDGLGEGGQAEVCQTVFGMPCEEKFEQYPDLTTVRTFVRTEFLYSLRR